MQACQPSWICRASHDFNCNLKVSQAAISVSRHLNTVANSYWISVRSDGFALSSSRLVVLHLYVMIFKLGVQSFFVFTKL